MVLWFIGMSGAGKSNLSNLVYKELKTKLNQILAYLNAVEKKLEGIIPYTKSKGEEWKKD